MPKQNRRHRSPLFDPTSDKPFRVSRTKVDLFLKCPLCFYLSQRLGAKVSDDRYFGLNLRIDGLLKQDSASLRSQQILNPRAQRFGINATPFNHPQIEAWLDIFKNTGLEHTHPGTNLTICGAPDDIWLVDNAELSIVDVKATHSSKPITESYFWEENKRQVEIYSWLLARQGLAYPVSNTSYFVRINTKKDQSSFKNNCLEFEDEVIPHTVNYAWIEPTLKSLKTCLMKNTPPAPSKKCGLCKYRAKVSKVLTIKKIKRPV